MSLKVGGLHQEFDFIDTRMLMGYNLFVPRVTNFCSGIQNYTVELTHGAGVVSSQEESELAGVHMLELVLVRFGLVVHSVSMHCMLSSMMFILVPRLGVVVRWLSEGSGRMCFNFCGLVNGHVSLYQTHERINALHC